MNNRPTYKDFKTYDAFANYIMDRVTIEERRAIRVAWNKQYDNGEKDWREYLLASVYNININQNLLAVK